MLEPKGRPSLPLFFWTFAKIGAFTFGGGYAMVPLMRAELVEHHAWLTDDEFAEILGLAQTAPGAIAINTAIFTGYRLRRLAGALLGCLGVVLPSFVLIMFVAAVFGGLRDQPLVARMFRGIRPAVVGLILAAVISMGKSLLRTWYHWAITAVLLAVALFAHPVVVLALAGASGLFLRPTQSGEAASC